jgi:hypothetical protein
MALETAVALVGCGGLLSVIEFRRCAEWLCPLALYFGIAGLAGSGFSAYVF